MEKFDVFNSLAETWDEKTHHDMKKLRLMVDILYIKEDDAILDVGTGTGILLPLLLEKSAGKNISAIDGAEKMIEMAGKKFASSGITFIAADVLEYPFNKNSFDHIICYSVFPHLEEKNILFERIAYLLKPGGCLSIFHSSSKERINGVHVHAHHHELNSDYLFPAKNYVPLLNKNNLKEEILIDNEEMFMICARKRWQNHA
jgi:demethylmenaquinone methyltransferase/2-methoxy-6-polyprenyl-1,4-benzoquinol methylase